MEVTLGHFFTMKCALEAYWNLTCVTPNMHNVSYVFASELLLQSHGHYKIPYEKNLAPGEELMHNH